MLPSIGSCETQVIISRSGSGQQLFPRTRMRPTISDTCPGCHKAMQRLKLRRETIMQGIRLLTLIPETQTLANRKVVMPPSTQSGMVVTHPGPSSHFLFLLSSSITANILRKPSRRACRLLASNCRQERQHRLSPTSQPRPCKFIGSKDHLQPWRGCRRRGAIYRRQYRHNGWHIGLGQ